MDYWCHAVIYIEQPASGSLLVTWQTDTLRLYNVLESPSTVTAVIEVFVALFFLYYIFIEVTNCRRYGKKYFGEVRLSRRVATHPNMPILTILCLAGWQLVRVETHLAFPGSRDLVNSLNAYRQCLLQGPQLEHLRVHPDLDVPVDDGVCLMSVKHR